MDKVSVIVPVYNTKLYLKKCIYSILSSTYKNLQVILIDDGSTDGSSEICDYFSIKDKRIEVFHQCNKGVSVARNLGIEKAKGEYITFVDSDDYIDSKLIEYLYNSAVQYKADYVVCGFSTVDKEYKEIKNYSIEKEGCIDGMQALEMHYIEQCSSVNYVPLYAKLYKKSIWDGIKFRPNLYYEDLDIMPSILLKCQRVVILNYSGYFYVQRPGSIMHDKTKKSKYYNDAINILLNHVNIFEEKRLLELRDKVIYSLLYKIMISDCHGTLPKIYAKKSQAIFKKYYGKLQSKNRYGKRYLQFFLYEKIHFVYIFTYKIFRRR